MRIHINKIIIQSFVTSLIIWMIISPLRGGYVSIGSITGFCLSSIVGFIVFYFLTIFFLRKKDTIWIPVSIAAGLSFFMLPIHLLNWESTLVSFLEWIIHLIGIIAGYTCYRLKKRYIAYIFSVLIISGAYVLSTTGYQSWLFYLNYHTFSGKISEKQLSPKSYFQNSEGKDMEWNDFHKELIVLDFWNKGCGYCYEAFPDVQKLHDAHIKTNVGVYAVYVGSKRRNENYSTGDSILKSRGYNFPALFLCEDSPILKELEIAVYPTVIVINKDQELVFRGNIEKAGRFVDQYKAN